MISPLHEYITEQQNLQNFQEVPGGKMNPRAQGSRDTFTVV